MNDCGVSVLCVLAVLGPDVLEPALVEGEIGREHLVGHSVDLLAPFLRPGRNLVHEVLLLVRLPVKLRPDPILEKVPGLLPRRRGEQPCVEQALILLAPKVRQRHKRIVLHLLLDEQRRIADHHGRGVDEHGAVAALGEGVERVNLAPLGNDAERALSPFVHLPARNLIKVNARALILAHVGHVAAGAPEEAELGDRVRIERVLALGRVEARVATGGAVSLEETQGCDFSLRVSHFDSLRVPHLALRRLRRLRELDEPEGVLLQLANPPPWAGRRRGRLGFGFLRKPDLRDVGGWLDVLRLGLFLGLLLAGLELVRELRGDRDEPEVGHVVHPIAHVRRLARVVLG
mmetsp:Transcript_10556/g.47579  ORF Transcript_10556/g.47579 Transcript_10556/m.47579 type:complete len:346 (-) Transcript_10556:1313-2350(-)